MEEMSHLVSSCPVWPPLADKNRISRSCRNMKDCRYLNHGCSDRLARSSPQLWGKNRRYFEIGKLHFKTIVSDIVFYG